MSSRSTLLNRNLALRLATGILGSAVLIFMLVYNYETLSGIIGLMLFLVLNEFYTITKQYSPLKWLGLAFGLSLYFLVYLSNVGLLTNHLIALAVALFMSIPIVLLFDSQRKLIESLGITFLGTIYISVPCCMLLLASKGESSYEQLNYNRYLVLGIFLIIWSNDTGAYFAGKLFGKTKLFQRVSPNKTLEGSVGGFVLALIIVYIYATYIAKADYPLYWWFFFTLLISVSGILGDLVESQIKRNLGVKDSGKILPGHGGFLDRFDALIFALPFAYIAQLFL